MKTKFFALFLLPALFLIGCKNDKPVEGTDAAATPKEVESKVKVVLDMVVPVDDTFQLFYTEDGTANCTEEKSVRVPVKGSDKSQTIIFDLSEDLAVTYLRLDVGENNKQGEMKINNFLVKYFDKKFEAKGIAFFQYFSPSEQLTIDPNVGTVKPVVKGSVYDPVFYGSESLSAELQKILK